MQILGLPPSDDAHLLSLGSEPQVERTVGPVRGPLRRSWMAAVPLCQRKSGVTEVTIIMPLSFTLTLTSIGSPVAVLVFSCRHSTAGAQDQGLVLWLQTVPKYVGFEV